MRGTVDKRDKGAESLANGWEREQGRGKEGREIESM